MGKKLLLLALAGAAVYLLKTKKGNEITKNVTDAAGKLKDKLYGKLKAGKENLA